MANIDVLDLNGKKVGTLELAEEVFGGVNEDLLWEAVKHYRAAQRAGTHATKNKKLVSGSGKKRWKRSESKRPRCWWMVALRTTIFISAPAISTVWSW